ncbi:MAG: type IV secretory system conjugative DNA transfer family protein, partial [Acidimicrobiales bacterium]
MSGALALASAGALAAGLIGSRSLGARPRRASSGARWATGRDLASLRIGGRGRIHIGVTTGRALAHPVWTERSQSVAVVGPTQSGKTSAIAIPAILGWDGPVVAVSVKTDLVADTVRWRRRLGTVWC